MKLKVAIVALCVASFVAGCFIQKGFGYDNKGGYAQPAYVNTTGYDNKTGYDNQTGYDNRIDYIDSFKSIEEGKTAVEAMRNGKSVQVVVPTNLKEKDAEKGEDFKK